MILRNLRPPFLTNGTRAIISKLDKNIIEAVISSGPYKGEHIILPRINFISNGEDVGFSFTR